jgi:hypothetical protein
MSGCQPVPVVERANLVRTAETYYEAAFRAIDSAGVLRQPSLELVQTAAILTLCNSNLYHAEREPLFLGLATTSARLLQMHRLGSESSFPRALEKRSEWSTKAKRDLGRRLWWTLVITDW